MYFPSPKEPIFAYVNSQLQLLLKKKSPQTWQDWRALSIYQLITDRFADGDPRNNELFAEGFDVRDMTYRRGNSHLFGWVELADIKKRQRNDVRHGGDFVGLTSKLPYIKGLGCEAVWISPIFQNGNNSYHQFPGSKSGSFATQTTPRFPATEVRHA